MGYRSNGRWIIKGPADTVIAAWAATRLEVKLPDPPDDVSFDMFNVYTIDDTGYIRFEFDDWKWYPSYSDIQFFEHVWAYLSDVDGLSGRRVHIGEDNAVEENCFGFTDVYLGVEVNFYDEEPSPPLKE